MTLSSDETQMLVTSSNTVGAEDARSRIYLICAELERRYGNPRHGNKSDPLDELVYIILSTRTREPRFGKAFDSLKEHYPSWDSVTTDEADCFEPLIASSGLAKIKTRQIVAIFDRLRLTFGGTTLEPLRDMTTEQAEDLLTSLPGVSAKVAKCVLMYSLNRAVLPVDVHVHRVATRLGLETKKRPDTSQDLIEAAVPPNLRYGFHVNAVAHGRLVCRPGVPHCEVCTVAQWCDYFQVTRGEGRSRWN